MNKSERTGERLRKMIRIAVLAAVMLLLEATGLGLIKTAGLEIAILLIPVIVGAITVGPDGGAILGAVFGLISFWECVSGRSSFGAMIFSINPFGAFLTCVPTRILAGWLCGLAFRWLGRQDKTGLWSFGVSSLLGALLNTLFFMTVLCAFFYYTEYIQGFVKHLGASNVFLFVIGFVGLQGLAEAIVCFFFGAAIAKAVMHVTTKRDSDAEE